MFSRLLLISSCFLSSASASCSSFPSSSLLLDPLPSLPSTLFQPTVDQISQFLNASKKKLDLPCLSAAIVYNGQLIWNFSLGEAQPGQPANIDTLYRIASVTKVFTTLGLFKLRDQGLVESVNMNVDMIEPRFQLINPFKNFSSSSTSSSSFSPSSSAAKATLLQLASHRAGLFDETPCLPPEATCEEQTVYQNLPLLSYIYPPGYRPSYSNFGFAVLGRSLEHITHERYENWTVREILQPLGMSASGFDFTPDVISKMALGDGESKIYANSGWDSPNGQMYSSVRDLASFMNNLLLSATGRDSGSSDKGLLFDSSTVREMFAPLHVFDDGEAYIGAPWETMLVDGHWVRTKNGNFDGFSAAVGMVPELGLGMVVLNNRGSLWPPTQLIMDPIKDLIALLTQAIPAYTPVPPLPGTEFVGNYSNDDAELIVNVKGQTLSAVLNGIPGYIRQQGGSDQFVFVSTLQETCLQKFFDATDMTALWFQRKNGIIDSVLLPGVLWGLPLQKM